MQATTVHCGECGEPLVEASSLPADKRTPCPKCGSVRRHMAATSESSIPIKTGQKMVQKRPGFPGGPKVLTVLTGAAPSRTFGWVHLERVIDRLNNWYRERVVAPDGTVTRDVGHPLTEHRGRGSARRKTTD